MGDVDGAAEPLDWRPAEPVPGGVQDADRNAGIDNLRSADALRGQAVLPRAREHDQRIAGTKVPDERHGHFVHVFADPGARAKRGSVVDQDAHRGPW